MPAAAPAVELLARPAAGRVFAASRRVRLGDVDRMGRLRLDATARYLQDIATDDANDAGLDRRFGWLVRRTLIDVRQPAVLGEQVDVATWCTGIGRSWAERRSSIIGARGALIDTVSLWVQIDVESGRPAQVADDFNDAYTVAADGRKVSVRLALGAPSSTATARPWHIRRTDLDPFDHVNNAATWSMLEDVIDVDDRCGVAELEYLRPIELDPPAELRVDQDDGDETSVWLTVDDVVHAASRWRPRSAGE